MTYPKVTEIKRGSATFGKGTAYVVVVDGEPGPRFRTKREAQAYGVQQQRIAQVRAGEIAYPQHPTVCPKR